MMSNRTVSNTPRHAPPVVLDARVIGGGALAPVAPPRRPRVLGAVAPQHRLLRGPTSRPPRNGTPDAVTTSPAREQRFLSNMEVLDALLAGAHERLINRLSRLGMRRGQAQRFVVAAAGRLLRASQRAGELPGEHIAACVVDAVSVPELAAHARVSDEQAERGLQVVFSELSTLLAALRR